MMHRIMGAAALGLMVLTAAGCATTKTNGDDDTRGERMRRGLGNAATTPLRDVGLIRPDIPDILEQLNFPYGTLTVSGGCANVLYEIGQLDAVLGDENYQPDRRTRTQRALDSTSNAAVDAADNLAGDVVPFRGWVRRLSGAQKAERRYARAIEMGQMRRAFLRGYGASLGCRGVVPAPPPPPDPNRREQAEQTPQQQPESDIGAPP